MSTEDPGDFAYRLRNNDRISIERVISESLADALIDALKDENILAKNLDMLTPFIRKASRSIAPQFAMRIINQQKQDRDLFTSLPFR
jgi:hypothetical protein